MVGLDSSPSNGPITSLIDSPSAVGLPPAKSGCSGIGPAMWRMSVPVALFTGTTGGPKDAKAEFVPIWVAEFPERQPLA